MSEPSPPQPSTSAPEPEYPASPKAEPEYSAAEPIPEWDLALSVWSWGWDVHWIGIGCLFMLLALYAVWSILIVTRQTSRRRRVFSIFIDAILFVFGISRGLFLFINPYESPQCHVIPTCPILFSRLLFATGLPCLTAAFSLVHLMFLKVMKLKVYPGKVQNWKFLLAIVTIHFLLAYFIECIVYIYARWQVLVLICQVFYIVFSIALSTSFLYAGLKIIKYVNRTTGHVVRMGQRSVGREDSSGSRRRRQLKPYSPNVTKLVKITYITAVLGLVSCALQIYAIFGIYKLYRSATMVRPKPVPWLVFQSMFRLVELGAGLTMAYVSPRQTKEWSRDLFPCFSLSSKVQRSGVMLTAQETSTSHVCKKLETLGVENLVETKEI